MIKKASDAKGLVGLMAGIIGTAVATHIIGGTMFGENQTKAIKAMMAGFLEAHDDATERLRDDLQRKEKSEKDLREKVRKLERELREERGEPEPQGIVDEILKAGEDGEATNDD